MYLYMCGEYLFIHYLMEDMKLNDEDRNSSSVKFSTIISQVVCTAV